MKPVNEQHFAILRRHMVEVIGIHTDLLEEELGSSRQARQFPLRCHARRVAQRSLAVCTIGQGLAAARSLKPKHAIKQVDRLLSNSAINVDDILARWVPFVIGARDTIVVAMDWTDFDADKHATIMLALITNHGRSADVPSADFRATISSGATSPTTGSCAG
jgi:hypothetical protein